MKKQSNKKYDRPDGLTYRLPGRKVRVALVATGPIYGTIVRNIYAKPDITRPTLCEIKLERGLTLIFPSKIVKVVA
jgi:hypothetical protein